MAGRKEVSPSPPPDFQVGGWLARPSLNVIAQAGVVRHLEPQVMDLLAFLATLDRYSLADLVASPGQMRKMRRILAEDRSAP